MGSAAQLSKDVKAGGVGVVARADCLNRSASMIAILRFHNPRRSSRLLFFLMLGLWIFGQS